LELLRFLARQVLERKVSQLDLQLATGVHQSQISRILAGHVRRLSPNVLVLCKYAETLRIAVPALPSNGGEELQTAITRLWDGSTQHALALIDALGAIGKLQDVVRRSR
jgi:transcriptional regulator with XRE-family HTH domain